MKRKTERALRALLVAAVFSVLLLLPASASAAAKIPTTAKVYNGHSYQIYDKPMTWTEAKHYCKKLGGHLVTISSKKENSFLVKQLKNCNSNWYWIGLEKTSGNWKLVTGGKAKYFNWDSEEPSGDGDYVQMYGKALNDKKAGTWNDIPNEASAGFYAQSEGGFICEWDSVYRGLSKEKLTLKLGDSQTLKVLHVSGTVKWSSSDTKVATVSSKGVVKAVKPGTATIRAKVGGKTYTCKVTVKNNNAKASSLKFVSKGGGMFIRGVSDSKISFKLNKTSANVAVSVKSASGSTVYTKKYSLCTAKKAYSFTWNGKKKSGCYVSPGTYTVTVKAGTTVTVSDALIIRKNEFAGGNGSKSNPFQVANFEQFKKIEGYNGYYFKQVADIDCGYATFAGMFSESVPFTGDYNGNGKTISNLFLADTNTDQIALFSVVDTTGVIRNLKLYNMNVTGNQYSAVLVRSNRGKITKCTVNKCSVSSYLGSLDSFSGILAQENAKGATITGCIVTNSTISASYPWQNGWTGGIVGHNHGNLMDCTIQNSLVSTTSRSYGWARGGGIVSWNGGNMINCTADGVTLEESSGNCAWSGGIASTNEGFISACSFVNGTAANTGITFQNGTYIS